MIALRVLAGVKRNEYTHRLPLEAEIDMTFLEGNLAL
jgi:hypothetical protein